MEREREREREKERRGWVEFLSHFAGSYHPAADRSMTMKFKFLLGGCWMGAGANEPNVSHSLDNFSLPVLLIVKPRTAKRLFVWQVVNSTTEWKVVNYYYTCQESRAKIESQTKTGNWDCWETFRPLRGFFSLRFEVQVWGLDNYRKRIGVIGVWEKTECAKVSQVNLYWQCKKVKG